MEKSIKIIKLFMDFMNKYTTGVPFIIWGVFGFAMTLFLIFFRNEPHFRFSNLVYVLIFSTIWFVASDLAKKRKILNERLHFWIDSLVYLFTFSSIFYFTGGINGELFFIFCLIAISAPLFGSIRDAVILLILAGIASIWVNVALALQGNIKFDKYHIGILLLAWLIYFAIAAIIKYFQLSYLKEYEHALKNEDKLEKQNEDLRFDIEKKSKLEESLRQKTIELEKSKENVEQQIQDRTKELNKNIDMLERMNKAMYGRELKMIELKKKIRDLERGVASDVGGA